MGNIEQIRRLNYDNPYRYDGTKFGAPILWQPSQLTNLEMWVDPYDNDTMTFSGVEITSLVDKSPNAYSFTSVTSSKTQADAVGGIAAMAFDGGAEDLQINPNPITTINDMFVIMVVRVDANLAGLFDLGGGTGDGGTVANRWGAHLDASNNLFFDCGGDSGSNRVSYTTGWSLPETHILAFYGSTTDNVQEIWIDGVKVASDASGHSVTTAGRLLVANLNAGGGPGDINATYGDFIMIDSTITTNTREKLEGYLAHKWGQTALLPGGHTYKTNVPEA